MTGAICSHRRSAWLAAGALIALTLPGEAPAGGLDLEGSWYVLIHYRDSATANPDSDRWADRLWTFENRGSRLHWTEYPIVVFSDSTGRFERLGRNPRSRVLHAWGPNEGQRAEIAQGLQVNRRGSKTKSLRTASGGGYRSQSRARSLSVTTIGYQQTWSIERPATLPVFTQDDVVGTDASLATGARGNSSGRTRYSALEVSQDGRVITGRYARDESRRGTFRLIRAGAPRTLESDGRTPNEKQWDREQERIRAGGQTEPEAAR